MNQLFLTSDKSGLGPEDEAACFTVHWVPVSPFQTRARLRQATG